MTLQPTGETRLYASYSLFTKEPLVLSSTALMRLYTSYSFSTAPPPVLSDIALELAKNFGGCCRAFSRAMSVRYSAGRHSSSTCLACILSPLLAKFKASPSARLRSTNSDSAQVRG